MVLNSIYYSLAIVSMKCRVGLEIREVYVSGEDEELLECRRDRRDAICSIVVLFVGIIFIGFIVWRLSH